MTTSIYNFQMHSLFHEKLSIWFETTHQSFVAWRSIVHGFLIARMTLRYFSVRGQTQKVLSVNLR